LDDAKVFWPAVWADKLAVTKIAMATNRAVTLRVSARSVLPFFIVSLLAEQ
jgi:hypothetical protein